MINVSDHDEAWIARFALTLRAAYLVRSDRNVGARVRNPRPAAMASALNKANAV